MSLLLSLVLALGSVGSPMLGGAATWYDWHEGEAAAGPTLRATLGPDWRGSVVTVCHDARCVTVRLTDSCWCPDKGRDRLVDLDRRDFAKLAPPSRGVIDVTVELAATIPLPPTDTAPTLYDWLSLVR